MIDIIDVFLLILGHDKIVKFLIEKGADVHIKNNKNKEPCETVDDISNAFTSDYLIFDMNIIFKII